MWWWSSSPTCLQESVSEEEALAGEVIPFGVVFASFMVCIMIGSSAFSVLIDHVPLVQMYAVTMVVAATSMVLAALGDRVRCRVTHDLRYH